jgi:hypothetical protein
MFRPKIPGRDPDPVTWYGAEGYKMKKPNLGGITKALGSVTKLASGVVSQGMSMMGGGAPGGGDAGGGAGAGGPGGGGGPGGAGGPGTGGSMYTPIGVYPLAQTAPISINIQVSGKDMAASAGSGKDEEIGQPPSMTDNTVDAEEQGLLGGLTGRGRSSQRGAGKGAGRGAGKGAGRGAAGKQPPARAGRGGKRQKYIESTSIEEEDSVYYFDEASIPSLAFVLVAFSILLL